MQAQFRENREDPELAGLEDKPPLIPFLPAGRNLLNQMRPLDKYQIACVVVDLSDKGYCLAIVL